MRSFFLSEVRLQGKKKIRAKEKSCIFFFFAEKTAFLSLMRKGMSLMTFTQKMSRI